MDCDAYCDEWAYDIAFREAGGEEPSDREVEEAYEDCRETCEFQLKMAKRASIVFDPNTLQLIESTIPGDCKYVWYDEWEYGELENWEKAIEEFEDKFRKLGCKVDTGWVHPHEIARIGIELGEEEYPAVCYYHIKADYEVKNGTPILKPGCKVEDVLKLIEKEV